MESNKNSDGCTYFILWIVLIIISVIIMRWKWSWGVVSCLVTGIIMYTYSQISKGKNKNIPIENMKVPTDNSIPVGEENSKHAEEKNSIPVEKITVIHQNFFEEITKEIEKVIALYEGLCEDDKFLSMLKEKAHMDIIYNDEKANTKIQIRTVFWADMIRCFSGLQDYVVISDRINYGLKYFLARTLGVPRFGYFQLNYAIDKELELRISNIVIQIKRALITNECSEDIFYMSTLIGNCDRSLQEAYLTMLYNIARTSAAVSDDIKSSQMDWIKTISGLRKKS